MKTILIITSSLVLVLVLVLETLLAGLLAYEVCHARPFSCLSVAAAMLCLSKIVNRKS